MNKKIGNKKRTRNTLMAATFALASQTQSLQAQTGIELGTQIWIEPTQSRAQIDGWFHTLAMVRMPVARIFLMWSDLETSPGVWDWTVYDEAFRAAEREHVRIVATLTPSGPPPFRGGDGTQGRGVVPSADAQAQAADYIHRVVERYRSSPALDTWLLLNEPGQGVQPDPLALAGFPTWLQTRYNTIAALNLAWGKAYRSFAEAQPPRASSAWNLRPSLDWSDYWRIYQTDGLAWLARQVRSADAAHPLHVNPHSLVANLAANNDDLPAWRSFLSSLGSSIHPAWHFGLLPRERYTLGVSYINDLVEGASRPLPHWVTELQGGNNLSSGLAPLNPTAEETTQWVWTSVGAGAKRVIFWLLNARSRGVEAGEWSLLDFQGRPSERLTAAAAVSAQIAAHREFFDHARPVDTPITLVVSLETMNLEDHEAHTDNPARGRDAQLLSTLGYYEAFSRLGVPPNVRHFDDYEWGSPARGRVAVLPDVRALSASQFALLEHFVANGNTLLLSGLTGFYDDAAGAWPVFAPADSQPLTRLTGARLREIDLHPGNPELQLTAGAVLPFTLWQSTLELVNGSGTRALGTRNGSATASTRDVPGGGKVLWLPATIGLGAWLTNAAPLTAYLNREFAPALSVVPIHFAGPRPGCLLRMLGAGDSYLTITANQTSLPLACELQVPAGWRSIEVSGPQTGPLPPGATAVTLWSRPSRGQMSLK